MRPSGLPALRVLVANDKQSFWFCVKTEDSNALWAKKPKVVVVDNFSASLSLRTKRD